MTTPIVLERPASACLTRTTTVRVSCTASGSAYPQVTVIEGEVGTPSATGLLTDADPDNLANTFQVVTAGTASDQAYGSYAMTAGGQRQTNLTRSQKGVDNTHPVWAPPLR